MPIEHERRFLVTKVAEGFTGETHPKFIQQGYFEVGRPDASFRVRITNKMWAELTIKRGRGISRPEIPHRISLDFGQELFTLAHDVLEKVRFTRDGWEVDLYCGLLSGIVIAEKELARADEEVLLPGWIGEGIEVTAILTNLHLARFATSLKSQGFDGSDGSALARLHRRFIKRIPLIVLTGGPCSGKSAVIEILERCFRHIGCIPELATIVINQGRIEPGESREGRRRFQKLVYRTQRIFEEASLEIAEAEGKAALVCDRGKVDGAAYVDGGVTEYEELLRTSVEREYTDYDLVICLDTAPQDVFEREWEKNPARYEKDYQEAVKTGRRIREVWQNHPRFVFVPNGPGGWDEKARVALDAILALLGQSK